MTEIILYYERDIGNEHRLRVMKQIAGPPEFLEVYYQAESAAVSEITVDASSPIGLFRDRRQTVSESENERLERCLSDLLLCQLYPHLQDLGATILVEGPPLSKFIGRIGYRYPRPEITIAFVTVDERYFAPPRQPPATQGLDKDWDGPFPDLQEESLTRRFYSMFEPQLRVDLFTQALNRPSAEIQGEHASLGLSTRLQRHTKSIRKFAELLRERGQPTTRRGPNSGEDLPLFKEHRPSERLAARASSAVPTNAETVRPAPPPHSIVASRTRGFSDHETFIAIFGESQSKVAKGRLEALMTFVKDTDLGSLADNVDFLRFVRDTLELQRYSRAWIFSQADLTRWYSEFREGRPGSKG